jgi:hypothetical protein
MRRSGRRVSLIKLPFLQERGIPRDSTPLHPFDTRSAGAVEPY